MAGSSIAQTENVSTAALLRPLALLLEELGALVSRLNDAQFTKDGAGGVRGSIGGHVRHVLDHVATLVTAARRDDISYDERERGTSVETSRGAATGRIAELSGQLAAVAVRDQNTPLRLHARLTPNGDAELMSTSLAREIAFVQSHTIHHNALIAALARVQGVALAEDFGYAPATIAARKGR